MSDKGTKHALGIPNGRRVVVTSCRKRVLGTAERAKAILEATTECYGSWVFSSAGLDFGDRWLASLGYSAADRRKGNSFLKNIIHSNDRAAFKSQLNAHLAGQTPALNCECRFRTKAGSYRWFEICGKVVGRGKRGLPVQLEGMILDIQARKQRHEALAVSDELSSIFEAAEDCIWIVDPTKFRLITCNKSFEDLIFKAHGIRVRPGMRMENISPEGATTWTQFYNKVLEQGKLTEDYKFQSTNVLLHVVSKCIVRDGQIVAICLFGREITPRLQIKEVPRKSEDKFAKAFLQGPSALMLTSVVDHRYIEVNDAFEQYTGYRREEVIGKSTLELGIWVDPEQRTKAIEELKANGGYHTAEVNFRAKSGKIREGLSSAALIEVDGEPCMLSVVIDLSEQKRALADLREGEARLSLAMESDHMFAFDWNPATDVVLRSKHYAEILMQTGDESAHTKREFIDMVYPDDREHYIDVLKAVTAQEPTYKVIFRLPRRDGTTVWLKESGRAFFAADGKMSKVVGLTSDVTDVRQSDRALRELSGRLISSQEEERRRIARELHDHIGQELALLCMQAQRVDSGGTVEGQTLRSDLHELYRRIRIIATDVSKLSHRLHSSELTFLGLSVAVERLCRDFASQYKIDIDSQIKNVPPKLDSGKALCFYRVLQEALQNVAKHSHATRVVVELQGNKNDLILKVRDNGTGFDAQAVSYESGLGLVSIRERLNLVTGWFGLESRVGYGTTLTARVTISDPTK